MEAVLLHYLVRCQIENYNKSHLLNRLLCLRTSWKVVIGITVNSLISISPRLHYFEVQILYKKVAGQTEIKFPSAALHQFVYSR